MAGHHCIRHRDILQFLFLCQLYKSVTLFSSIKCGFIQYSAWTFIAECILCTAGAVQWYKYTHPHLQRDACRSCYVAGDWITGVNSD